MPLTYTYTPETDPMLPLNRARRQLGDTGAMRDHAGVTVWLLSNEEITGWIDADGYAYAVANLADALAVQYAQEPDSFSDEGGVTVSFKERVAAWKDLARTMRQNAAMAPSPQGGGVLHGVMTGPDMTGFR